MIDPIGIAGIIIGVGVAWWQNRKAEQAENALNAALNAIPSKVVEAVKTIVVAGNTPEVKTDLPENWPMAVEYIDADGDGKKEMVVQYPGGAHGSQLKVFAWRHGEFTQIGALGVGTPAGFEIGDFDGDGKPEIKTEETDWSAGLPYVSAPRMTLLYRWNGSEFAEVSRRKNPEIA
jgi:hypothetical protein